MIYSDHLIHQESEDGDDRPQKRLVSSRRGSSTSAPGSNQLSLSHHSLLLFLGIAFVVCLAFLVGIAINKYVDGGGSALGEGALETVTVTAAASKGAGKTTSTASTTSVKSSGSSSSSESSSTSLAAGSSKTGAAKSGTFPGLSKNGIGIGELLFAFIEHAEWLTTLSSFAGMLPE